jgi:membrane-associated phospholipid phosphatase
MAVLVALAAGVATPADDGTKDPGPAQPAAKAPNTPTRWQPDDKRRTMRGYGGNLAYNFIGVWTPGNRKPLLLTAAATAPAFALDNEAIAYFGKDPHSDFAEIGRVLGGGLAVGGLTVGMFSAGRFAHPDRFRAMTYDLSQAVIVNGVYTQVLKYTVRRNRPDKSNRLSFPSGHASNAFTGATVISRHYPAATIPAYAVATFIAASRMAANKHHLSDVVAGAGLGFGIGRVVVRRNGRPPEAGKVDPGGMAFHFDAGPAGDGRGIAFTFVF